MELAIIETMPNGLAATIASLRSQSPSTPHQLTENWGRADLVIFAGDFALNPERVIRHPAFTEVPDKCVVYTEEDYYLPLLPGVYASAASDYSSRIGRVRSFAYLSTYGQARNPHVCSKQESRSLLFSFQGGSTSLVRKRLYKTDFGQANVLVENTSNYHHWELDQPAREDFQKRYAQTVAQSHFVLCPRGAGTGSIRLFEVMQMGVAPVLLSDAYPLPHGPNWSEFLIRVPESDLHALPGLLTSYVQESKNRATLARLAWEKWFAPDVVFDRFVEACRTSLQCAVDERAFRRRWPLLIGSFNARRRGRAFARNAALTVMKKLHIAVPYELNR